LSPKGGDLNGDSILPFGKFYFPLVGSYYS